MRKASLLYQIIATEGFFFFRGEMNRWNDSSIQDQSDNYLFSGYSVQKSLTIVILAVLNLPLREFLED